MAIRTRIRQKIEEAAKIANAGDFISRLPQGYDTFVGDRGDKAFREGKGRGWLLPAPSLRTPHTFIG